MKLLHCRIEGFGNLKDFDMDFHDGLYAFEEKNGWGKSTLAAFLRVMFFGFDHETKRDEIANERKRFFPWGEKQYGGSVTFEVKGKKYRVERIFDAKKSAGDVFRLYDAETNLPSAEYSEKLGEELFHIDSISFKRTVFIGQKDVVTYVTPSIQAKIGKISDQSEDLGSYEKAESRLKEELNALTPHRKTGEINKLKVSLDILYGKEEEKEKKEREILRKEGILCEMRTKKTALEEEVKELRQKLSERSRYDHRKAVAEKKETLESEKKDLEEKKRKLLEWFPKQIPDLKEMNACLENLETKRALEEAGKTSALSMEEREKKAEYEKYFFMGIPNEKDLLRVKKEIEDFRLRKEERAKIKLSSEERGKFKELDRKFSTSLPSEEEVEDMIRLKSEADKKRENLQDLVMEGASKSEEDQKKRKIFIALFSVGIFHFILAAIFFLQKPLFAVGGILPGMIFLAVAFLVEKDRKKMRKENEKERTDIEREAGEKESTLAHFFEKMHLSYQGKNALGILYELKADIPVYEALKRRQGEEESRAQTEKEEISRFLKFFYSYGLFSIEETGLEEALHTLHFRCNEYHRILEKEQKNKEFFEKMKILDEKIADIFLTYGFEGEEKEVLSESRDRLLLLAQIEEDERKMEEKIKKFFEEQKDMDFSNLSEPAFPESVDELNESLNRLEEEIEEEGKKRNILQRELASDEDAFLILQEEVDKKKEMEERKERLTRKFEILQKTKDYLEKAKVNFCAGYMEPIKNSFDRYYGLLTKDKKVYEFDANLELRVKEVGQARDLGFLSEGYKDLVGLCRRMSFIEAMYEEEKPFLILDDPFVNFDQEKLSGGIRFLKEIAKEYQIIYFYCHESRKA